MSQPLTPEALKACIETLENLLKDRTQLSRFDPEETKELLMAAGRLSRPGRLEMIKIAKLNRKRRDKKTKDADRALRASTYIRKARQERVFIPPPKTLPSPDTKTGELKESRYCYICKAEYNKLHFFYDSMCTTCAELNYAKRFQTARLDGQVALITGARVKIGYQTALILLKAGAKVIVTTRFPKDAASRFAEEPDFADWGNRLQIYGLDLRHSPSVELFAQHIHQSCDRLDILINNAAQTVRRPAGFYDHLLPHESRPYEALPSSLQSVLSENQICRETTKQKLLSSQNKRGWVSLLPFIDTLDKINDAEALFPRGKLDADLQQIDLRKMNSWRMKLADVPTPEMIEVQLVNSIAPFILCAKLKPLMLHHKTNAKHIVNVSAMEGKFTRYTKTDKHPHTNMAKAALNMMTLTSAPDYAKEGIYMNAVDTGWVTDEDPVDLSVAKQKEHDFHPPLDIVDGAARICDPIFTCAQTGQPIWGQFLKDYTSTSW